MLSSSYLTIDLSKIRAQLEKIRLTGSEVMPMIKANAYGTDPLTIARFFETCPIPILGVSHTSEGIFLREQNITLPIFVLSAPPFEAGAIAAYNLTPAVSTLDEIAALESAAKAPLKLHLNINTGMNRFGIRPEEAQELVKKIYSSENLELEGIMSHLAASDDSSLHTFSQEQIDQFHQVVKDLPTRPKWVHIACSGSLGQFDVSFCNLVRIGRTLVEPAFTWEARVVALSKVKMGETVGYGRTYRVEKENMRLAVLPVGYYDGYPRIIPEGYVLIHGRRAPIIGRVCMDFMMVDVTDIPETTIGDLATLVGPDLPLLKIADWSGMNIREILAHLSTRTQRRYISHDSERLRHALQTLKEDPVTR